MQAYFEIKANDRDITALLMDRLLEIRVTDKPGLESDECEIRIDDRDGAVSIPPKGHHIEYRLGLGGQGADVARYVRNRRGRHCRSAQGDDDSRQTCGHAAEC